MLVYLSLLLFTRTTWRETCIAQLLFKSLCLAMQQTPLLTLSQQQHHNQRCMCSLRSCYLREKSFMGMDETGLFNVIWLKSIHTFIVTVFTAFCINTRISKECITIHCCYDILCTALFKALFHVPLLYFEHLPLQRSLPRPCCQHTFMFQTTPMTPFKWNPLWQWNLFRLHAKIFCLFVSLCF